MPSNFLTEGNGILRCYNLFPRQFRNFYEMTEYLTTISEMGFNAIWLNPLQEAGGVIEPETFMKRDKNYGVKEGNSVTGSLYAMQDPNSFNRDFSVAPNEKDEQQRYLQDKSALVKFTEQAKKLNLVPLFDLVLNHVAANSQICKQNSHWFKGIHPDFKDANAFNYDNPQIRNEIIEQFWKPYIRKYFIDYGFDGVRVDAVGYLHPELRQTLYNYIYDLCEKNNKPKPVILDEALFSRQPPDIEAMNLLLNQEGPTHILAGTHQARRDMNGSYPDWAYDIIYQKEKVIFKYKNGQQRFNKIGGTVNFTGNHDLNSLAGSVLSDMARTFLSRDSQANALYSHFKSNFILPERGYEDAREKVFLYPFILQIESEMQTGNQQVISEFERRLHEKIAIAALTAGAGWYLLCGDEYGDRLPKPVFKRKNGTQIYPQQVYKLFETSDPQTNESLYQMAKEDMQKDWPELYFLIQNDYASLETILLGCYIQNIKNQINCQVTSTCERFAKAMRSRNRVVTFSEDNYIDRPRNYKNNWLGKNNLSTFIKSVNTILNQLPKATVEFNFEVIPFPSQPELLLVLRKSGQEANVHFDLCIINLTPDNIVLHPPTWQRIVDLCQIQVINKYNFKITLDTPCPISIHTTNNITIQNSSPSLKDQSALFFITFEKNTVPTSLPHTSNTAKP